MTHKKKFSYKRKRRIVNKKTKHRKRNGGMLGRVARLVGHTGMKLPVCKYNNIVETDSNTDELLKKLKNEFGEDGKDYSNYYTTHCDKLYKLIDRWIKYKQPIINGFKASWGDRQKEPASLYYLALFAVHFMNNPDDDVPDDLVTLIAVLNKAYVQNDMITRASFSGTV